jgi:hypothetical protein
MNAEQKSDSKMLPLLTYEMGRDAGMLNSSQDGTANLSALTLKHAPNPSKRTYGETPPYREPHSLARGGLVPFSGERGVHSF